MDGPREKKSNKNNSIESFAEYKVSLTLYLLWNKWRINGNGRFFTKSFSGHWEDKKKKTISNSLTRNIEIELFLTKAKKKWVEEAIWFGTKNIPKAKKKQFIQWERIKSQRKSSKRFFFSLIDQVRFFFQSKFLSSDTPTHINNQSSYRFFRNFFFCPQFKSKRKREPKITKFAIDSFGSFRE